MTKASQDVYMVKFVERNGHKSELGRKAYEVQYIFILPVNMHSITLFFFFFFKPLKML